MELEEVLDRSSINAITVAMIFKNDVIWIDIKQIHGQSLYCTLCGKGCTRSINLDMHMRTCTGSSTPAHSGGAASCLLYNENEKRLEVLWK